MIPLHSGLDWIFTDDSFIDDSSIHQWSEWFCSMIRLIVEVIMRPFCALTCPRTHGLWRQRFRKWVSWQEFVLQTQKGPSFQDSLAIWVKAYKEISPATATCILLPLWWQACLRLGHSNGGFIPLASKQVRNVKLEVASPYVCLGSIANPCTVNISFFVSHRWCREENNIVAEAINVISTCSRFGIGSRYGRVGKYNQFTIHYL